MSSAHPDTRHAARLRIWTVWKASVLSGFFVAIYGCVRLCAPYGIGIDGRLALLITTLIGYAVLVRFLSPWLMRRYE